jgi:hypothetical protein
MEQTPMNSYVDLQIIDCNRQHSVQAKSGNDSNPALFTNELGEGIELNVGDRVAVQAAYISEIGAGADTIELNGRPMNTEKTITYTKETAVDKVELDQAGIRLITDYQVYTSEEDTHTFIPKDNETTITCEFYKTAGGDGTYIFLPRRWAWDEPDDDIVSDTLVKYWADNWLKNDIKNLGRNNFEVIDGQFCSEDYMYIDTSVDTDTTTGFHRLKQDGSRYTLMRAVEHTFYLRSTITRDNGTTLEPSLPGTGSEPAHFKYRTFRNRIDIKVSEGFNSPENIGKEITAILKKQDSPKIFESRFQDVDHYLSATAESPTYKPFLCASSRTMSRTAWTEYSLSHDGSAPSIRQAVFDYQSNFYNVYCKRPEIREFGQEINPAGQGYHIGEGITRAQRTTSKLKTKILWSDRKKLADLFKAQGLYPELFSNFNAQTIQPIHNGVRNSVDNMRYLHMSNNNYGSTLLGNDGTYGITPPPASRQSLPVFFYYQKENADKDTDGSNVNDLAYGFATKWTDPDPLIGLEYIELHPDLIGGINDGLFTFNNVDMTTNRRIGYDWSFGAYGSAHMIAFNGRLPVDFGNCNAWGIGDKNRIIQASKADQTLTETGQELRQNYVGANIPSLAYDATEARFLFQNLHTAEFTGQTDYGAGDSGVISDYVMPRDNTPNGNQVVYKINKRVNQYVYSPELRPYDRSFKVDYPYPAPNNPGYPDPNSTPNKTEREISLMNRNITPWAIIDSPCGIYINDFGYTEEQFENGLWGILGWTYNSLQSTATSDNNRLQRIDNTNKNLLSIPTTNADILPSDSRNFIVNQFGAVYFTTQIPTPSLVGADPTYQHSQLSRQQFSPAITQGATSIKLVAPNLPRKMLKPYYCIRSDIIDKPHYLGGEDNEAKLPVVAVCDKQYSSTDFIFSSESDYIFTITKNKKITSITTSIHDPNQSFSRVNNDSAVIYKISKNISNPTNIAQQVMEAEQKK